MKVIRVSKPNMDLSIYPVKVEKEGNTDIMVCIQIDKKKTRDKVILSKEDWFKIADQVTENCFG